MWYGLIKPCDPSSGSQGLQCRATPVGVAGIDVLELLTTCTLCLKSRKMCGKIMD
jgi:hypothetical protein